MKLKHFILLFAVTMCLSGALQAQKYTTHHMMWDSVERQYIKYVPASYQADKPTAVLFLLHGLGDTMQNAFTASGIKQWADRYGWIVVTPQALPANVSIFGQTMSLGNMWNAGIRCQVSVLTVAPNSNVDDAGFLMALLDSVEQQYNIHKDSVFFAGFSMGGFMSHRMAVEHGDRIKAIVAVSGTLAGGMVDSIPKSPVRVMHIHGTNDPVVSYDSSMITFNGFGRFSLGLGAEATVDYWRTHNNCSTARYAANYADSKDDGLTFERYLYLGGDSGTYVIFVKVINGTHFWYNDDNHYDINYSKEIVKFLRGELPSQMGVPVVNTIDCSLYPNPTAGMLAVQSTGLLKNVQVYDMQGRLILTRDCVATTVQLDVTKINPGVYVVKVCTEQGNSLQKLVVQR